MSKPTEQRLKLNKDKPSEDLPVHIEEILPGAVPDIWPRVEDLIRDAVNACPVTAKLETPQDVCKRCYLDDPGLVGQDRFHLGLYSLWVITVGNELKAALVVSLEEHPRTFVVVINYCGGSEMEKWINPLHQYIVERGRNAGARFIKIDGRYGWIGHLKKLGFEKTGETFMLEI